MAFAVLFKRKGAKTFQGATLVKKGVGLTQIKIFLKKNTRKGYITKIITQAALKKVLRARASKIKTTKKRTIKRTIKRKR